MVSIEPPFCTKVSILIDCLCIFICLTANRRYDLALQYLGFFDVMLSATGLFSKSCFLVNVVPMLRHGASFVQAMGPYECPSYTVRLLASIS